MLNLATMFEYSANLYPDKIAVVCGPTRFTYRQIQEAVNRISNALSAEGIGKGDNVAVSCPNLPYFPMVYYAILKCGATVVPLNVLSTVREISYFLNDCNAKAYFCFEGTSELPMAEEGFKAYQEADACDHFWFMPTDPAASSPIPGTKSLGEIMSSQSATSEMANVSPDDTAVILYTSGTTGMSKGAELSHSNLTMNALVARECLQSVENDVQIISLPLFHSLAHTCQMNVGFSMGNCLVLIPRFSAEAVLKAIQEEKGTVFIGVPTMYWALLSYKDTDDMFDMGEINKNFRVGVSGGSPLSLEIIRGIEKKYSIPILEGYGLSETCPVATFNQLTIERKPGSVGKPIWGVEVKVVDSDGNSLPVGEVGEVVVRGHNVMKGYFGKTDETKKVLKSDGWFHTGDMGRFDEDGYLYIVDRLKEMIIRGGFNVYPREVEEVLMAHPAISLVAVVGVPHDQHGEEVKAYVVLKEGCTTAEEDLVRWSKELMASYKYPRIIEFRSSLPMTATGKILKKELKLH